MVVDLVTFRVKRGKQQEFERHNEEWVRLMRRSRGFIAQVLMRSADDPGEYHAEIRWVNRDYRDRFAAGDDLESKSLRQKSAAILDAAPAHRLLEYV
jgi:heme-degrading monooxygenase HmoA